MSEETPKTDKEIEKLSAIRDIIFGNEIKEYNQEFSQLKKMIDQAKAESSKMDESIKSELGKKLDDLSAKMEAKLNEIDKKISDLSEQKTDRQVLGDLLLKMGEELKS